MTYYYRLDEGRPINRKKAALIAISQRWKFACVEYIFYLRASIYELSDLFFFSFFLFSFFCDLILLLNRAIKLFGLRGIVFYFVGIEIRN